MAGGESGKLTPRDSSSPVPTDELDDPERLEDLRRSVVDSRRQIADSIDRVRSEFREAVDWRSWAEEHPVEAVGIAFGIGFCLGFR